jgi:hypothetical protein
MGKWKFSFPIDGIYDVIKQKDPKKGPTIKINEVLFHYRGDNERVGTVTIEGNTMEEAEKESKYMTDNALGKICFAFNTEASISEEGFYFVDLTNNPNVESVCGSCILRWSYVKEDQDITLSKMKSIRPEKIDILDLALSYYNLGEDKNPLRIDPFFSSITVLVRDLWKKELQKEDYVSTNILQEKIKLILRNRSPTPFNEKKFDEEWKKCYPEERCSIVHGKGSKLIDPKTIHEYDKMTSRIGYWGREVIYYYIDNFQNLN